MFLACPANPSPHEAEGLRHRSYGASVQSLIADQDGSKILPRQHPSQEPHRRGRVATVDRLFRCLQARAIPRYRQLSEAQIWSFLNPINPRSERLHRLHRVDAILGRQKPVNQGSPFSQARQHRYPMTNALVPGHGQLGRDILEFADFNSGHDLEREARQGCTELCRMSQELTQAFLVSTLHKCKKLLQPSRRIGQRG
jgi:hypothetical protein